MPTYDYKCQACGHTFEKFQSITSAPIRKCPKCGKNKVKRLLGTGAGLIFKGSGFYITDYRSEGYKNAAKADSGGSGSGTTGGGEKSGGGSENKPAASSGDSKPAASESKSSQSTSESKSAPPPSKKSKK